MRRGCWHPHRGPTSYSSVSCAHSCKKFLSEQEAVCSQTQVSATGPRGRSRGIRTRSRASGSTTLVRAAPLFLQSAHSTTVVNHYYPQADARCCAANNTFRGLRSFVGTQDLAFVQYTTSEDWMYERPYHEELYDMTSDHYQCVPLTLSPDLSAWPVLGPELLAVRCSSRVADDCLRAGCRISAARPMLRWCRSCRRGWRRSGTAPGRAADCL